MNSVTINKGDNSITLYGNKLILQKEQNIIENLELTGMESKDRLIIQKCIDDNDLKSSVSYNHSTIYPCKRIIMEYRKLQKSGTLEKLSERMYQFFTNACEDIAHYSIQGYKDYYNYSLEELENRQLKNISSYASRFSDIDNIFKKLKIGKYFKERENINIDILSLKDFKNIIDTCNFSVKTEGNTWIFKLPHNDFSFSVLVIENKPSSIINAVRRYYKDFDKDEYIKTMYESNKGKENPLSISKIVYYTDYNLAMLSKFSNDLLYKARNISEIMSDSLQKQEMECDLELEI